MYLPRRPTYFEMADYLEYFLAGDTEHNWEDMSATESVDRDVVAVFDNFYTPYPAYSGRIMIRLSGLGQHDCHVYVWKGGTIMSVDEYKAQIK